MVECELLDRLSILTYLAQYFQAFNRQEVQTRVRRLVGGNMSKSSSCNSDLDGMRTKLPPKMGRLNEPCRQCSQAVEIISRLNVGGRILHRTCFKCARCDTQLSLASYYETETGDFCCEVCPDEEKKEAVTLKANKNLATMMSADSGHSSDEEEEEEGEKEDEKKENEEKRGEEDATVTSAYAVAGEKVLEIEKLTSTDFNANVADIAAKLDDTGGHENVSSENCDEDTRDDIEVALSDQTNANNIEAYTSKEAVDQITQGVAEDISIDVSVEVNDNEGDVDNETILSNEKVTEVANNELLSQKKETAVGTELDEDEYPDGKNPFDDEEEDEKDLEEISPPVQANLAIVVNEEKANENKKDLSTNPFGSDLDSDEEEESKCSLHHSSQAPTTTTSSPSVPANNSSLNPFGSDLSDLEEEEVPASPSLSVRSATAHKKRRAPLPPGVGGVPLPPGVGAPLTPGVAAPPTPAPRLSLGLSSASPASPSQRPMHRGGTAKRLKDADNLQRRSQIMESIHGQQQQPTSPLVASSSIAEDSISTASETTSAAPSLQSSESTSMRSSSLSVSMFAHMGPDKAEEGQWRKKKGPAPARPIPPKRTVKKLARKAINQELTDIEVKQGELERQGVKLEKHIREICARADAEEGANRDSLGPEAEDLIIQLFDLVNEKNELFRRQTELIYMKKENRLEEQHADCEYQIRVMMSKPECQRTEEDKKKEDRLISKLVEIVGLRNEIVDCLEMDRLRELDEDTAIENHMSDYAAVQPVLSSKKGGLEKILKIKMKKKKKDRDNEKDVDTSELDNLEEKPEKPKKKSAKKKILNLASKGLASSKQLAFPHKN